VLEVKPFILDFSIARESEDAPGFQYDEDSNLNVIMTGNGKLPFVDADVSFLELATKTEVKREEDEPNEETLEYLPDPRMNAEQDRCGSSPFLELLTKTKVDRESDDE
jgi:hypothetical protein